MNDRNDGAETEQLDVSHSSAHRRTSRCEQYDSDESTRSKVAGIVHRARERNLGRAAELACWVDVARGGRLSSENRAAAAEIAHQLAGSAGTFGYRAATDIARVVEGLFVEGDGEQHWARTRECILELTTRLHEAPEIDNLG